MIVKLQTSRKFVSFPALLTISLYSDHITDHPLPYCRHLARVSQGEVSHHHLTTHRCHHHSLDTQCHYLGTHYSPTHENSASCLVSWSLDSVWSQGVCDQHTAECSGILSILTSGVMCSGVHRRHRPAHYHPAVSREVKLSASVKTWRHTVDTADTYSGYNTYSGYSLL